MASLSHTAQVRRLYKSILRLHRGLPQEMRLLGDEYTKSEFRRHKDAEPSFVAGFMSEWTNYALQLSRQLGKAHFGKPLGTHMEETKLDQFTVEQLCQLYELYEQTKTAQDDR